MTFVTRFVKAMIRWPICPTPAVALQPLVEEAIPPVRPPNWWEMAYEPNWQAPIEQPLISVTCTGFNKARFIDGTRGQPRENIHLHGRTFDRCDFRLNWQYCSFTNCHFVRCRFNGSLFEEVKFSDCTFERCNFSHFTFSNCKFIAGCKFRENSASAEQLRIRGTTIEASEFVSALQTNTRFIPLSANTTAAYQRHKLVETKAEFAQMLFSSTKDESDVDLFFDSYKQLILRTLTWRIERRRFKMKAREDLPEEANYALFLVRAIPSFLERGILKVSGLLTNWGRSITRPAVAFVPLVFIFYCIYTYLITGASFKSSAMLHETLLRAIDVTLVAGYTAHCSPTDLCVVRWITAVNMVFGLFWYSLFVPVLTRRLLR